MISSVDLAHYVIKSGYLWTVVQGSIHNHNQDTYVGLSSCPELITEMKSPDQSQ